MDHIVWLVREHGLARRKELQRADAGYALAGITSPICTLSYGFMAEISICHMIMGGDPATALSYTSHGER